MSEADTSLLPGFPVSRIEELRHALLHGEGVNDVAERFALDPAAVVTYLRESGLDKDRRDLVAALDEEEEYRYRQRIRERRLPTVDNQLQILDSLNNSILQVAKRQEKDKDTTSSDVKRLSEALEKAAAVAGRLLNIRENLFDKGSTHANNSGAPNVFILPGTQAKPTRVEAARPVQHFDVPAKDSPLAP